MTPLMFEILGSVIRTAAAMLSGYLVTHHFLMAADGDRFTTELTMHALLCLPMIGALAWSIAQKYLKDRKLGSVVAALSAQRKDVAGV